MQEVVADKETLVMKRVFRAPIEKVYQAWTDPEKLVKWFKPNERWAETIAELDPVAGGKCQISMIHSDGDKLSSIGKFKEVVPNSRLSFTWNMPAEDPKSTESVVTIEFFPVPEGTELILTHSLLASEEDREGKNRGWSGILETFDQYLSQ